MVTLGDPLLGRLSAQRRPRCAFLLFVISYPDEVPGRAERIPGDVKPAGGGQQLVGQFVRLEEVHEALELAGVLGANVGSLAKEVLRALDATDQGVDARVAVA